MELTIDCKTRNSGDKPNAMRRNGQIPAILYGHKGAESAQLAVEAKAVETLLKKASLNNTVIQLNVSGQPWSGKTLLREVQYHPAKGSVYHLSFFAIGSHTHLEITVPLHFTGSSIGVKNSGGILDPILTELQVQCAPDAIPDSIDVDVSDLDVGSALHIRELNLPKGVTALGDAEQVVVMVGQPQRSTETSDTAGTNA